MNAWEGICCSLRTIKLGSNWIFEFLCTIDKSRILAVGCGARELGCATFTATLAGPEGVWGLLWSSTTAHTVVLAGITTCTVAIRAITVSNAVAIGELVTFSLTSELAILIGASHSTIQVFWFHCSASSGTAALSTINSVLINALLISRTYFIGWSSGWASSWSCCRIGSWRCTVLAN